MLRVPERDVVEAVRKLQQSAKEAKKGPKRGKWTCASRRRRWPGAQPRSAG